MGWSWAMHFCQLVLENLVDEVLVEKGQLDGLLRDGLPSPSTRARRPLGGSYVDNALLLAPTEEGCNELMRALLGKLRARGLRYHEHVVAQRSVDFVGVQLDLGRAVLRNTPHRTWRLRKSLSRLLSLGQTTPHAMQKVAGHLVHFFTLSRSPLSLLRRIYDFQKLEAGKMHSLSPQLRRELRVAQGLLCVAHQVDLAWQPCTAAFLGDSSSKGFALSVGSVLPEEVWEAARFSERWRFRRRARAAEEEEPLPQGLWRPGQYAHTEVLARLGVALPPAQARPARRSLLPAPPGEEEVVGIVPALADALLRKDRWTRILRGGWARRAPILDLEARVLVMGLRRACRDVASHGTELLSLSDNLSAVCAFTKGRATEHKLRVHTERAAGYALACGVRWKVRHVRTHRNLTDHDSRAADRGEVARGRVEVSNLFAVSSALQVSPQPVRPPPGLPPPPRLADGQVRLRKLPRVLPALLLVGCPPCFRQLLEHMGLDVGPCLFESAKNRKDPPTPKTCPQMDQPKPLLENFSWTAVF